MEGEGGYGGAFLPDAPLARAAALPRRSRKGHRTPSPDLWQATRPPLGRNHAQDSVKL